MHTDTIPLEPSEEPHFQCVRDVSNIQAFFYSNKSCMCAHHSWKQGRVARPFVEDLRCRYSVKSITMTVNTIKSFSPLMRVGY